MLYTVNQLVMTVGYKRVIKNMPTGFVIANYNSTKLVQSNTVAYN